MLLRAAIAVLLLALVPSVARADKRVALVIGNSAYKYAGALDNPKNDATDMAAALKKLGFQVIDGFDLDKAAFDRKVRDFADRLARRRSRRVLLCRARPAGGRAELSGADRRRADDGGGARFRDGAPRSRAPHDGARGQTNILFLDACRDNPLARNLARAMGTRSAESGAVWRRSNPASARSSASRRSPAMWRSMGRAATRRLRVRWSSTSRPRATIWATPYRCAQRRDERDAAQAGAMGAFGADGTVLFQRTGEGDCIDSAFTKAAGRDCDAPTN